MKTKIELTKKQKLLMAAGTGMLLLVILWPVSGNTNRDEQRGSDSQNAALNSTKTGGTDSDAEAQGLTDYVAQQEKRLKQVLEKMDGIGEVTVMITARASRELVVEKDVTTDFSEAHESDGSGGERVTTNKTSGEVSVMQQSGQGTVPYVIKTLTPEIAGVAVAAKGAGTAEIDAEIIQVVQALFDVPIHKIKVVKMK